MSRQSQMGRVWSALAAQLCQFNSGRGADSIGISRHLRNFVFSNEENEFHHALIYLGFPIGLIIGCHLQRMAFIWKYNSAVTAFWDFN